VPLDKDISWFTSCSIYTSHIPRFRYDKKYRNAVSQGRVSFAFSKGMYFDSGGSRSIDDCANHSGNIRSPILPDIPHSDFANAEVGITVGSYPEQGLKAIRI